MNASTYKKNHNYKAEYLHELEKNDKTSNLLIQLDRENERLSDKLEQALIKAETQDKLLVLYHKLLDKYGEVFTIDDEEREIRKFECELKGE